jgi:hypothetical protein
MNDYLDQFEKQVKDADGQQTELLTPVDAADGHAIERDTKSKHVDQWDTASERFPRRPFPWDAFPPSIAKSLKQVALSCATSNVAMPGAAMAIMASVLGRTVSVSPKKSWDEPLVIWSADIRESGEGKTPPARMLLKEIYNSQQIIDDHYEAELAQWTAKQKKDKGLPPKRPEARYVTNLTLEGIHKDVQQGHGGMISVLDELSSIISSQDQYKQKGSDREAWISLWDGHPARISRASQSMTIGGARVSVVGGIQPNIFRKVFGGNGGAYLFDGTIFRFLFTYQTNCFVTLTDESWSDENQEAWQSTLRNAITWADNTISIEGWKPHVLKLSDDARKFFQDYRNSLYNFKNLLPAQIRGFIPKSIGYVLRIAGILDCIRQFSCGTQPGRIIASGDIKKAISVMEFYLAHTVSAMRLLESDTAPVVINETTSTLAKILGFLRDELDSGRLAVGYIFDKFNEQCTPTLAVKSEKAMGALLREHGLTIPAGKSNANGRRGVCCLTWDDRAEQFVRTLQTSANQSPQEETLANTEPADIADIADIHREEEYDIEGTVL